MCDRRYLIVLPAGEGECFGWNEDRGLWVFREEATRYPTREAAEQAQAAFDLDEGYVICEA